MKLNALPVSAMLLLCIAAGVGAQDVVRPMAADANPSFEVATIKRSNPEIQGKDFSFAGHHVWAQNYNVNDMLAIAYGLHPNQVIGAPAWFSTTLYDIDGVPDTPGIPNQQQKNMMMQKLLTDRFQLRFHREKRILSAYAMTIAGGGPRLIESTAGPNEPDNFRMRWLQGVTATNMTLGQFAIWFQKVVMDKPVVDHTGLTGRYDFKLDWTPDQSQFQQMRGTGISVPPPSDNPKASPDLYTAFREQLGLKLESIKAPTDVIVIDHAEPPSPN
jgi:uncharacterized protein (TIGR03435 family)